MRPDRGPWGDRNPRADLRRLDPQPAPRINWANAAVCALFWAFVAWVILRVLRILS